jgi:methylmalonyl-CoA mutase cobalamin-binding domain/chain
MIVRAAIDEDADVIGISVLSGAHNELTEEILCCLREHEVQIPLVVGGTIGPSDREALLARGAAAVFPVGTSRDDIAAGVRRVADRDAETPRAEAASGGH